MQELKHKHTFSQANQFRSSKKEKKENNNNFVFKIRQSDSF